MIWLKKKFVLLVLGDLFWRGGAVFAIFVLLVCCSFVLFSVFVCLFIILFIIIIISIIIIIIIYIYIYIVL